MTALRLAFLILTTLAVPAAAHAQTFYGAVQPNRTGERVLLRWAYVGDRHPHYSHVIWFASPSRPEGFWFHYFRNGCFSQSDYGASWGFVYWDGSPQTAGNPFDQFDSGFERSLTHTVQCGPAQGQPIEGEAATQARMRDWQAGCR